MITITYMGRRTAAHVSDDHPVMRELAEAVLDLRCRLSRDRLGHRLLPGRFLINQAKMTVPGFEGAEYVGAASRAGQFSGVSGVATKYSR